MSLWALIPIKSRGAGKTRLSPALGPEARLALIRRLLAHVVTTVGRARGVDEILVLSPERDELPPTAPVLLSPGRDLNADLSRGLDHVRARGGDRALILPADLPRLEPWDVEGLIRAGDAGFAVAPDQREEGTNGLAFDLDLNFRPAFGPLSFERHLAAARSLGLEPRTVRRPGFADIDRPEDLSLLGSAEDPAP